MLSPLSAVKIASISQRTGFASKTLAALDIRRQAKTNFVVTEKGKNNMAKREYKKQTVTCKHNAGVECEPRCAKCHKCGWNPDVDKERRESDSKSKK
jgi:hypothetical protein